MTGASVQPLTPVGLNSKFTTARCPCCSPADRARAFSLLPAASVNVDVGATESLIEISMAGFYGNALLMSSSKLRKFNVIATA